jgi:hypothetical protein
VLEARLVGGAERIVLYGGISYEYPSEHLIVSFFAEFRVLVAHHSIGHFRKSLRVQRYAFLSALESISGTVSDRENMFMSLKPYRKGR